VSRLFIELYLDEDVDVLVAELIRSRGFRATTTVEAGMLGANDLDQLEHAASCEQTILTHNRVHFERMMQQYFTSGRSHAGIIIAVRRPPYDIAGRLLTVLNNVTADEMTDQVIYI
jgi:hypothetical protein